MNPLVLVFLAAPSTPPYVATSTASLDIANLLNMQLLTSISRIYALIEETTKGDTYGRLHSHGVPAVPGVCKAAKDRVH